MSEWIRRRVGKFRVEVAAAVLIPAFVVGVPLLSNTTTGSTTIGVEASGSLAGVTTTTGPSSTTPTTGYLDELPVGGGEATLWELSGDAGGAASPPTTTAPAAPTASVSAPRPIPVVPSGPSPLRSSPGTPGPSPTTTTTLTTPVPRPPANLALDFDSSALVATWEAVATNLDGTTFVGTYEISFTAAGVSRAYTTIAPGFTYTLERNRLDFGTPQPELMVSVRAVGVAGNRSGALTEVATNEVPPIPTSPPVLVAGQTLITVSATAPARVEDLAGFEIYHSNNGVFELLSVIGITDVFHHAVAAGSTHSYVYRIRDVFGQVSPGFSPIATTTTS